MTSLALGALVALGALTSTPAPGRAQDEASIFAGQDTLPAVNPPGPGHKAKESYDNLFAGEFTPGRGFDIIKTERGSLNISMYGLFRWLDQMPGDQTYRDHLGRERTVRARNDLNWHRTFAWLTGFFYDPRFRYNVSIWSLPTTQQSLIFGNLRYTFTPALRAGVGIGPNLTARSLTGTWPYWAATDRQMSEEFMRGGFSSSFWLTGMPVDRLYYTASVNTNLSQLGVTASNDTRDFAYSGTLWWMPTTGEFGPRGGFGDFEHHERVATRFGASACTSHESRYAPVNQAPNATQIKLSDGILPFEADAFAVGDTVNRLRYDYLSADFGAKYKGFSFQGEYYYRMLSDFQYTGPTLPVRSNKDTAFMIELMHMVVPKTLGIYLVGGYVADEFRRYPHEISYGASYYPFHTRAWRVNAHVINIDKSPTASNFGYYAAGQTGTTISLATDFLF